MKDLKDQRLEELIVGMVSDTLTEEEVKEYNLLCKSPSNVKEIKQNYQFLINNLRLISSEKASDQLFEKILKSARKSIEKKPLMSLANLLRLMVFLVSGFFVFQLSSNSLKYAFEGKNEKDLSDYLVVTKNKNIFTLRPIENIPNQSEYINASVVIRENEATNLLTVNGLPQLASGLTYRLWAQTAIGLQGCVSFLPDKEGNVQMKVPSEPTKSAIKVMITIDQNLPGYGPEKPGQVLLSST